MNQETELSQFLPRLSPERAISQNCPSCNLNATGLICEKCIDNQQVESKSFFPSFFKKILIFPK